MPVTVADIAAARERIRGAVVETPLRHSDWLSRQAAVSLKIETIQPTCSYKIRGAFNAALRLIDTFKNERPRIVTASAGNHGRALAYAAQRLGLPLVVFIASDAPRAKSEAIRAAGAELRPCADYDAAERQAKAFAGSGEAIFISPYAHPDVIAGAGTIALELLEQQPQLDAVVVPVGGGGLISGIGTAIKARSPRTRVFGVEVAASSPFTQGLAAGRIVPIAVGASIADGLTGNLDPDTPTFDIVRRVVDEIVVVDEASVRKALAGVVTHEHVLIEGAAATGVAAVLSEMLQLRGNVAVVLTGANIDAERIVKVLTD